MPAPTTPADTSFAPSRSVATGWQEPIFIVQMDGVFYLSKVVWPYDPAVAAQLEEDDPQKISIDTVTTLFNTHVKLDAVNVLPQDVLGVTHGFAGK